MEQFYQPFAREASQLHQDESFTPEVGEGGVGRKGHGRLVEEICDVLQVIEDFMASITGGLGVVNGKAQGDEDMMEAIARLKEQGLKVALLTNNWRSEKSGRLLFDGLGLFDQVHSACASPFLTMYCN